MGQKKFFWPYDRYSLWTEAMFLLKIREDDFKFYYFLEIGIKLFTFVLFNYQMLSTNDWKD